MKPYFIQDDDANYLNPDYIFDIFVVKISNLASFFVLSSIKEAKNNGGLESKKSIDTLDVRSWMNNFICLYPKFDLISDTYKCENKELFAFEMSDLIHTEIHTALDRDKISHINSIYENNTFKYFEIIYIDSDQATIREFESEELAQAWINENFTII